MADEETYPSEVESPHEKAASPLAEELIPDDGRLHRIEITAVKRDGQTIIENVAIFPYTEPIV